MPSDDLYRAARDFHQTTQRMAWLELMRSPPKWPMHPFLCLAHATKRESCGLGIQALMVDPALYPNQNVTFTVFVCNLYLIPKFGGSMTEEEFFATKYRDYASYQEILDDGWLID